MKTTFDFTAIDIYVNRYWCNHVRGQRVFTVNGITICNITEQQEVLNPVANLVLGDCILLDTKFGHNLAKAGMPENWIDVPLVGEFQVVRITPQNNSIELKVRAVL